MELTGWYYDMVLKLMFMIVTGLLAFMLYRKYKYTKVSKSAFDEYYSDILNSDNYKVKGKFEL